MMAPEPLRSAMTVGGADDTSLAVPSDDKLRSGQRRVLDQVHSIKRGKSKQVKADLVSPTSPVSKSLATYTEFGMFKFSPASANSVFTRANSTMATTGYNKTINTQKSRSQSTKSMRTLNSNSGTWEQKIQGSSWIQQSNGLTPSCSDPALAPPLSSAPASFLRAKGQGYQSQYGVQTRGSRHSTHSIPNGTQMTNSQTRLVNPPFVPSGTEGKMGTLKPSRMDLQQTALDSGINISDVTLKDAVSYLSHPEENFQQFGATFIQHTTFKEEHAKQEVFQLEGIPGLITLLRSPNPMVSLAAAGALRNLVFKHEKNKQEVQHYTGIAKALQLLKETDCTDTQKQITGLLWNLSSSDDLKKELTLTALPALTENVVVPFTCWSDNINNNNIHPDVFYNATGCLRNLSCASENERKAMRACPGLIDSLMNYVQSCVAEESPDDKAVENCVCILHNLTYQLEKEEPNCFSSYRARADATDGRKSPTVGCFSPKSSKAQKQFSFDMSQMTLDDSAPSGQNWLCHPKAMQTYLSLLGSSKNDSTREACCGVLQNLTAGKELGSMAMSHILVQKMETLLHISPLLKSTNPGLQKTAVSLLSNMSRNSSVQATMAKQILPDLTQLITFGTRQKGKGGDTLAMVCNTAQNLIMADPEAGKKVIDSTFVTSLANLAEDNSPKSSKAASLLLYSLWNDKTLQGVVRKLGFNKSLFVNGKITELLTRM
ncbi:plakophilin-1 [Echeneis naucrates]|uniref:Plakophilin-1-like n=1 Tax=Echeneis naucrates TaxID=173247 RepID=A0A665U9X6_ECHNA|nr:plakophilin-1-like [Echeneis naucrates]